MGYDTIDNCLWYIEKYLMIKYGVDAAHREIAPLKWYIATGRASALFLKRLAASKPYVIGRKLHLGGSDDEVIERIKKAIKTDKETV